jgi:phage tail tape-measure protein
MSKESIEDIYKAIQEQFETFEEEIKEFYELSLKSLKFQLKDLLEEYSKTKNTQDLKKLTYLTNDIFNQLNKRQEILIKHKKEIVKILREKEKYDKNKWKF